MTRMAGDLEQTSRIGSSGLNVRGESRNVGCYPVLQDERVVAVPARYDEGESRDIGQWQREQFLFAIQKSKLKLKKKFKKIIIKISLFIFFLLGLSVSGKTFTQRIDFSPTECATGSRLRSQRGERSTDPCELSLVAV